MQLCTDNAAMAAIAVEKWRQQEWAPLDLDAVPAYVSSYNREPEATASGARTPRARD
jgi:hypothetical protein